MSLASQSAWGAKREATAESDEKQNVPDQGSELDGASESIVSEKDSVALVSDSSVGEAVKRRPDLNFANVKIDGESSGVSLSSISADSVESVEVMKAVTPDMDADSRGGSISLKSRPTYAQKKIVTKIETSLSYDSLDSSKGYRARVSAGGPLNQARTLGGRAAVYVRESPYSMHTLYQDWQTATIDGNSEFVLKDTGYGSYQRDFHGKEYSLALDYKATDALSFFWRGTADYRDYETNYNVLKYRYFRGSYVSIDDNGANVEGADIRNSIWNYTTRSDELETTLGGTYENKNLIVDFKYTYKDNEVEYLDYFTVDFVQDDLDMRYDLEDPRFPTTTLTNGKDLRNASAYKFEDLNDLSYLGSESDAIGAANLKWTDLFGRRNLFLKAGLKSRTREYNRSSNHRIYSTYHGSFTAADVLSDLSVPDLLDGRYNLDTVPDAEQAENFYRSNIDGFELNERRSRENSDPNTYSVNEQVDGYYAMLNFEQGKWRTIIGMRQEKTKVDFLGNEVVLGKNEMGKIVYKETNPVPGTSSYDNVFPNAHFRYKFSDTITVIGSYTNTIDRPAYTYLVPYRRVNLEEKEIEEGNPNLKPTLFNNYDLSVDFELPSQALVSVELFNRSVEDFVFSRKQIVSSGIYQGFEVDRFENSASADIKGATITWRQPLEGFILPEGLSLNANYTKQKSEMEYPARPGESLPLTNTPDIALKLALTYQSSKVFAQVRYAYDDLKPTRIAENKAEDTFLLPSGQIDLSLSYQVKKNISWFADVANITNGPSYDRYEGSPIHPAGYRILPWTLSSGVRFEL